jgi:hypothetical protein
MELVKPPTRHHPNPFFHSEPAPLATAIGNMPSTIAIVVIKIRRNLSVPAAISASNEVFSRSFSLLAKSTIRIEFLQTNPIITISPILCLDAEIVFCQAYSLKKFAPYCFLGSHFKGDMLEMANSTSLLRRKTLLHQTNKGVCRICIFLLQVFSTFISNLIRSNYEKIISIQGIIPNRSSWKPVPNF